MSNVVQGPWKKKEVNDSKSSITIDTSTRYPWHTLSGPQNEDHDKMMTRLQKLANLGGPTGCLRLPDGWFWDPAKNQALIDQLLRIGQTPLEDDNTENETLELCETGEIPDDIA